MLHQLLPSWSEMKTSLLVDAISDRRNDRQIGGNPTDVPDHVKYANTTKHPASVIVFGLFSSDGKKMPPVSFPPVYMHQQREIAAHSS